MVQSNKRIRLHSTAKWWQDVFVHISALERAGLNTLNEGATVDYEIISDRGKESAGNLKLRK
jgi:cold shock protein